MHSGTQNIHRAAIFSTSASSRASEVVERVDAVLAKQGIDVQRKTLAIQEFNQLELADIGELELAVVVGGDGAFLNVARSLAGGSAPIIGVNLGRRGFLTDVSVDEIEESFNRILNGRYAIEKRPLIDAEVCAADSSCNIACHALNDIVVHKTNIGRLIECEVSVDGEFMAGLRADGIIVAAPTGSTAYAMAAGGPILHPTLDALELIPVCPQALGLRPVVVNNSSEIIIRMIDIEPGQAVLAADGHIRQHLNSNESIKFRRSSVDIDLIRIDGHGFFNTMRQKLGWGG